MWKIRENIIRNPILQCPNAVSHNEKYHVFWSAVEGKAGVGYLFGRRQRNSNWLWISSMLSMYYFYYQTGETILTFISYIALMFTMEIVWLHTTSLESITLPIQRSFLLL